MGWRKGRSHVTHNGEKSVAVGNEDLDMAGGVGDFGGGAEEVGLRTEGAIPEPDLMAGFAEAGGDTAANDAKADDPGGGRRRVCWIGGGNGIWLGRIQGSFKIWKSRPVARKSDLSVIQPGTTKKGAGFCKCRWLLQHAALGPQSVKRSRSSSCRDQLAGGRKVSTLADSLSSCMTFCAASRWPVLFR